MGSVVRTGVDATRLSMIVAEVAGRGLDAGAGDFSARVCRIVEFDRERMQVDVAVRTVVGAEAASNAPILDDYFEGVPAADGADGASDHAQRIAALPATRRYQILVEPQSIAH